MIYFSIFHYAISKRTLESRGHGQVRYPQSPEGTSEVGLRRSKIYHLFAGGVHGLWMQIRNLWPHFRGGTAFRVREHLLQSAQRPGLLLRGVNFLVGSAKTEWFNTPASRKKYFILPLIKLRSYNNKNIIISIKILSRYFPDIYDIFPKKTGPRQFEAVIFILPVLRGVGPDPYPDMLWYHHCLQLSFPRWFW